MENLVLYKQVANNKCVLMQCLAEGDKVAFDELFYANWDHFYPPALAMTKSSDFTDDIARNSFLSLWKGTHNLAIVENLKGFLLSV